MKKLQLILMLTSLLLISRASEFQDFLDRVNSLSDPLDKQTVVDSFIVYAESAGVPFVEGNTANFIYKGFVSTVQVAGDFNSWNGSSLSKLSSTDFWYYTKQFELDARFDYKLIVNGNWILDPRNPNRVLGGYGPNSELAMPDYIQPEEIIYNNSIAHGTRQNFSIQSDSTGRNYNIYVYLPPSYDSLSAQAYPTVYFQDGSDYINYGYAINILDNLIANEKIDEVIAVFARPYERNSEYAYDLRYRYVSYFVDELVPYIDEHYSTIQSPQKRLIMGDSFGGNISGLISYLHPSVFGLCGLHSGAFWPNNYEIYNMIVNGEKKDIKYYAVWGSYEGQLASNMRTFLSEMPQLGYEISGQEFHEGHSWGLWRATTDLILEYFFPSNVSIVESEGINYGFQLSQNYPNPFNPSTKINFSIPSDVNSGLRKVKLIVYDALGKEAKELINDSMSSGNYEVEFNLNSFSSGIYFYTLTVEGKQLTKKMILLK